MTLRLHLSLAAFAAGSVALVACAAQPPSPATPAAPTELELRNATIVGVFDRPATLKDGRYEGAPYAPGAASRPSLALWDAPRVSANLDGSPGDETAVLLSESSGGSGERVYLAVMGIRDGKATNPGTLLVGDRVKVRAMTLADGVLVLDVVQTGPDEPACCGTQLARRSYSFQGGSLREAGTRVTGTLSVAVLEGVEWRLHAIDRKPLPADVKSPNLRVESGRVAGFGGCNRYMGGVTEAAPGAVKFTQLASTMMACEGPAMQLEQRYLRLVGSATQYTFLAGRLALIARDGERAVVLEFDAATAP